MDVPLLAVFPIPTSSREERKELRYSVVCLAVRELCSVGIYVYVNMCVHVPALPQANAPWSSYLLAPPQDNP